MATPTTNETYEFLGAFPKGINTDISPLLLPRNQLAFASNITLRGDFAKPRPNLNNLQLIDNANGAFQLANTLFQGACYYQGVSDGFIMCAVGGKLFQIAIAGNTATISQITLPDAGNSPTATQHWLRQAEPFLIWNDNIHLPMFWDGSTARRSLGPPKLGGTLVSIGSILTDLTVPPYGQTVPIQVSSNVTAAATGLAYLLGASQFTISSVSNSSINAKVNLQVNVLQSAGGDQLLCVATQSGFQGANIQTNSSYIGTIATGASVNQPLGVGNVTDWGQIQAPGAAPTITIQLAPATGLSQAQFEASALQFSSIIQSCLTFPFPADPYLLDVGDPLTVDGVAVTVKKVTNYQVASYIGPGGKPRTIQPGYLIQSVDVVPVNQAQTGNLTAAVVSTTNVYKVWIAVGANCGNHNTKVGILSQPQGISASNGSTTWQGAAPAAAAAYFTVKLNQDPQTLSTTTKYTFKVFGSNGQPVTFTGFYGGKGTFQLVNCQMNNPPPANTGYLVQQIAGFPTALNQYVQITSITPVINTIAQVYNAMTIGLSTSYSNLTVAAQGSSMTIPLLETGSVLAGQLLFATATNGNTDVFVATATSLVSATNDIFVAFVNQSGIPGSVIPAGTQINNLPELPIGSVAVYGLGRVWMAVSDTEFIGGDLNGSFSGTAAYNFKDGVLKVSQNLFLAGGTSFVIPSSGGQIAAMQFMATLDVSLGQGPLQVFTDTNVFSCNAPTDATIWANLTSPILTESLIGSGGVSPNAVTQSNGDLLFRRPDGNVQSMLLARLDFNRWGNTPISRELSNIIGNDNPLLLKYDSTDVFNNRYLLACQPQQTPRGVAHQAIASLLFDPISSLAGKAPAIWESQWTGTFNNGQFSSLNVLQIVTGKFGGVGRCFALTLDPTWTQIQVTELLNDNASTLDNYSLPVTWSIESSMIFGPEYEEVYKRLYDGEIWIDSITPNGVTVSAFYKTDQNTQWTYWFTTQVNYQSNDSGYRPRIGLGEPNPKDVDKTNNLPMREGDDFQVKLQFTGYCRFLRGRFAFVEAMRPKFATPKAVL